MTCLVQQVESAVEVILGDEQDAFDNMPESLQYAEKARPHRKPSMPSNMPTVRWGLAV